MSCCSICFHRRCDHALHKSLLQFAGLRFDSQVLFDRFLIRRLELVQVPLHLDFTQFHKVELVFFLLLLKCSHSFSNYRLLNRIKQFSVGLGDLHGEILQIRVRYNLGCGEVLVCRRIRDVNMVQGACEKLNVLVDVTANLLQI